MDLTVHCVTAVLQPALLCWRRKVCVCFCFFIFFFYFKKGTSVWADSSVNVYSCDVWAWTRVRNVAKTARQNAWAHHCQKSSRMRQVRDKGTSTTSWSSFVDLTMAWIGDQDVVLSSEALTLIDNNSYYNLRQHTNYFVLVPGMIGKTLVGGRCSTQSNLRCI